MLGHGSTQSGLLSAWDCRLNSLLNTVIVILPRKGGGVQAMRQLKYPPGEIGYMI